MTKKREGEKVKSLLKLFSYISSHQKEEEDMQKKVLKRHIYTLRRISNTRKTNFWYDCCEKVIFIVIEIDIIMR